MYRNFVYYNFHTSGIKNVEEAARWCFPGLSSSTSLHDLDKLWNEAHSDLFVIKGSDDVDSSMRRCAKEYIKYFESKWNGRP